MVRFLLMQNSRVLLEESTPHGEELALKLCINRQIIKLPNRFKWSEDCQRWESGTHVRFEYFLQCPLELELYLVKDKLPEVIGEGIIYPSVFDNHLNQEIKVLLSYDGLVTGWLYCQFICEGEQNFRSRENEKFLSLQKLNLNFLDEIDDEFTVKIKQNSQAVFQKVFRLNQRSKTLFPNIKRAVRLSDVIKIEITHTVQEIKPIMFLVDTVKRGKSSTLEYWLRNKHKNKMGSLTLEYFMENLFLQNERQMRSRKAIIPDSLEYVKTIVAKKIAEKEVLNVPSERKNSSVIKQKIQEVDKRILKINNGVNKILNELKNQEAMPCLKKSRSNLNSKITEVGSKEKLSFYFENEER